MSLNQRVTKLEKQSNAMLCPECKGFNAPEIITLEANETEPPPEICKTCGNVRDRFIIICPETDEK